MVDWRACKDTCCGMLCLVLLGTGAALGAEEVRSGVLRTPDSRFEDLQGYDFEPHYVEVNGFRIHYVDEGPAGAPPILLLHGEPTWSYLYRKMIPLFSAVGRRSIAPDLIGFGRSDKPTDMEVHTYEFHVQAITGLIEALDLKDITLVCQDWGSLIGLRVAAENEARFARIVLANGGLPTGQAVGEAFMNWRAASRRLMEAGDMPIGTLVARNAAGGSPEIAAAYDAPFPDPSYKAGPLVLPSRVPISPDDPAAEANRRAWQVLRRWEKPFLTAFSDGDPITRGGERAFREQVPGARGQPHTTIVGAGHFLQEEKGEELAAVVIDFIARTEATQ